jgi:hypothetical protein
MTYMFKIDNGQWIIDNGFGQWSVAVFSLSVQCSVVSRSFQSQCSVVSIQWSVAVVGINDGM